MLKDNIVNQLIKKVPDGTFLKKAENAKEIENQELLNATKIIISTLPKSLRDFLAQNKLSINFINKEDATVRPRPEEFAETSDYAYSYFDKFEIYLIKPKASLRDAFKAVLHHFSHEIGHFAFIMAIQMGYLNEEMRNLIKAFNDSTIAEGGCSLLADKYVREEYGKQLRKYRKHKIFRIDIKFHENFAEFYRLYTEYQLESSYIKDLAFSSFFPEGKKASSEVFLGIYGKQNS